MRCPGMRQNRRMGTNARRPRSAAAAIFRSSANRCVAEDVEPTVTGKMCAHGHRMLGSPDTDNGLTRVYDSGCVISTATGALGALSFPARSTAVTIYQ